jgi:hypothetical protein
MMIWVTFMVRAAIVWVPIAVVIAEKPLSTMRVLRRDNQRVTPHQQNLRDARLRSIAIQTLQLLCQMIQNLLSPCQADHQ